MYLLLVSVCIGAMLIRALPPSMLWSRSFPNLWYTRTSVLSIFFVLFLLSIFLAFGGKSAVSSYLVFSSWYSSNCVLSTFVKNIFLGSLPSIFLTFLDQILLYYSLKNIFLTVKFYGRLCFVHSSSFFPSPEGEREGWREEEGGGGRERKERGRRERKRESGRREWKKEREGEWKKEREGERKKEMEGERGRRPVFLFFLSN